MTEPCASSFYKTFVVRREPAADPELMVELAQARRLRNEVITEAEKVCADLERIGSPLAPPLRKALERYKHPFDLVAHDPVP